MIPIIIGSVLAAAGITTLVIGCKRIKLNHYIQEHNRDLEKENTRLIQEQQSLSLEREKEFHKLEAVKETLRSFQDQLARAKEDVDRSYQAYVDTLDLAYCAKELEYDTKVNELKMLLDSEYEKHQRECWEAFRAYVEALDKYYQIAEKDFDKQMANITKAIKEHEEDLEQIRQTYAAAREAQIREEEIANQADFYSLHLTEMEQATISLIEEIKPRLPEPRVLCMLIWTTFYQKQTTALCNQVLGTAPICGIYKITNKTNGLSYIGQAVNIADRWKQHIKCGLGIDTPTQNKLYKAMLKDGVTNFTFELLEQCDRQLLNDKERFYINLYQAYEFGYNSTSGNKGAN